MEDPTKQLDALRRDAINSLGDWFRVIVLTQLEDARRISNKNLNWGDDVDHVDAPVWLYQAWASMCSPGVPMLLGKRVFASNHNEVHIRFAPRDEELGEDSPLYVLGDVVRLRSGSAPMVVSAIGAETVECTWFPVLDKDEWGNRRYDANPHFANFLVQLLERVPGKERSW